MTKYYTASTDWFYTGISVTIPANTIFSLHVEAVYQSSPPVGVSIQNYRNASPINWSFDTIAEGIGHTTASGYASASLTFYVWAKYANSTQNFATVQGWIMPAQ